jgi:hypothetical protein
MDVLETLQLNTQSLAVDVLRRGDEPVLNEISYKYASWAVLGTAPAIGCSTIFEDFAEQIRAVTRSGHEARPHLTVFNCDT